VLEQLLIKFSVCNLQHRPKATAEKPGLLQEFVAKPYRAICPNKFQKWMIATDPVCLLRWSIQESTKPKNHLVLIIPQAHNFKDLATSESFCPFPRMNLNDDFFPLKSDFPPDSVSHIPLKKRNCKNPWLPIRPPVAVAHVCSSDQ